MAGRPNNPTKVAVIVTEKGYWLDTELYKHPDAPVMEFPWAFIERYKAKRDEWLSVQNEIHRKVVSVEG